MFRDMWMVCSSVKSANGTACCCFGVDRKPDVLRSRRHRHQRHLEKEKPGRVLECRPMLCRSVPITALIEHCLTPFISWMDESFSLHVSVSRRHLV